MSAADDLQRWTSLQATRGAFDDYWQRIAERVRPERADFTVGQVAGAARTDEVLDGTAIQARRGLATTLQGMLLPTGQRWFAIKPVDDDLEDDEPAGLWLEHVEREMWTAIYNPKARFIESTGETVDDLVTFGSAVLFITTNAAGNRLLFRGFHLRDCWFAENEEGDIDTLYLKRIMTAKQVAEKYGPDANQTVRDALRHNNPETTCEYLHVVAPRNEFDPRRRDNLAMPFAHRIIDVKEHKQVEEGGFDEFPFAVPRWETVPGEVYGRSPAMHALPDIMTLNEMRRTTLAAAQKAVDPPIFSPSDAIIGEAALFPGGFNNYDPTGIEGLGGAKNAIFPFMSGANISLGLEMENQTREMVWNAFLRNVLQLPVDAPQMTATEVLERRAEFMRVAGPTFARQENDLNGTVANRVFHIMMRAGAFKEPPESLQGRRVEFEFRSAVQQAQKRIEAMATMATMEQLAPFISVKPELIDNFDTDRIARDIAEGNGMPHDHLVGRDRVEALRAQRTEAQALQAQMEAGMGMAEAAGRAAPALKAVQEAA